MVSLSFFQSGSGWRRVFVCCHYHIISVSDVCSRGGDREAVILDVDIEKNQIHVHYVGGSEDEDEWVSCEPQGVQLPPMSEKTLIQLAKAKVQEVQ